MKKEKEVDLYGLQTGEAVLLQIDGKMSNLNLFQNVVLKFIKKL